MSWRGILKKKSNIDGAPGAAVDVVSPVTTGAFKIKGVELTATATELNAIAGAGLSAGEFGFLDGALAGTQVASKCVVADANINSGISKVTELHIGATGSETQVTIGEKLLIETADGTIPQDRLAEVDGSADLVVGTLASQTIVGKNNNGASVSSANPIELAMGYTDLVTAGPVTAGRPIKCADNGRIIGHLDNTAKGSTIKAAGVGTAFTNQPANDSIEIVSSDSGDTDIPVEIIGTTNGGIIVVSEAMTTDSSDGTTFKASAKSDWGVILAVKITGAHAGTITVREASADQTITTLSTGTDATSGVATVAAASQSAFGLVPQAVATGATTKTVGISYQPTTGTGTALNQAKALNGASEVSFATAALTVEEVYVGDVEAGRSTTIKANATEEDEHIKIGKAVAAASTAGSTVSCLLNP